MPPCPFNQQVIICLDVTALMDLPFADLFKAKKKRSTYGISRSTGVVISVAENSENG